MTASPASQRNTVRVQCDQVSTVRIDDIFVSMSIGSGPAYMVHPCGKGGLHWTEISMRSAELLVALGAHAEVVLDTAGGDSPRLAAAQCTSTAAPAAG
jgi:hypothetical protein